MRRMLEDRRKLANSRGGVSMNRMESDRCPVCKNDKVIGDAIKISTTAVEQAVYCLDCDAEWVNRYKLVSQEVSA